MSKGPVGETPAEQNYVFRLGLTHQLDIRIRAANAKNAIERLKYILHSPYTESATLRDELASAILRAGPFVKYPLPDNNPCSPLWYIGRLYYQRFEEDVVCWRVKDAFVQDGDTILMVENITSKEDTDEILAACIGTKIFPCLMSVHKRHRMTYRRRYRKAGRRNE